MREPLTKHYMLIDGQIVTTDLWTWGRWLEEHPEQRIIRQTQVGDIKVSTVFLGLDHNFSDTGPPILFETMIFGGELDGEQRRHETQEEAEVFHAAVCAGLQLRGKLQELTK